MCPLSQIIQCLIDVNYYLTRGRCMQTTTRKWHHIFKNLNFYFSNVVAIIIRIHQQKCIQTSTSVPRPTVVLIK